MKISKVYQKSFKNNFILLVKNINIKDEFNLKKY